MSVYTRLILEDVPLYPVEEPIRQISTVEGPHAESVEEPIEAELVEELLDSPYKTIKMPKSLLSENAKYVSTQLLRAGFNKHLIAGIMGNLAAESMFNPTAFNSAGGGQGALGIAQWRGDRLKNLNKLAKLMKASPTDIRVLTEYLIKELKDKNAWLDSLALLRFNEARDVNLATLYTLAFFERGENVKNPWKKSDGELLKIYSKKDMMPRRIQYANSIHQSLTPPIKQRIGGILKRLLKGVN